MIQSRTRAAALFGLGWALLSSGAALGQGAPPADLGDRVVAVFEQRCVECHAADTPKPGGEVDYILDLRRVAGDFVEEGSAADSYLWQLMTDPEQTTMPPKAAKNGPMTTAELALVKWWIEAGTPAPSVPAGSPEPAAVAAPSRPALAGRLHPLVIHFPIALLLFAALADVLGRGRESSRTLVRAALLAGAVGGVLAAISGWIVAPDAGYSDESVFWHRWLGVSSAGVALIACALNERARRSPDGILPLLARIALLGGAALVSVTGHLGGILVYGEDYFSL